MDKDSGVGSTAVAPFRSHDALERCQLSSWGALAVSTWQALEEDLIVELLATHLLYSSPILNTTYDWAARGGQACKPEHCLTTHRLLWILWIVLRLSFLQPLHEDHYLILLRALSHRERTWKNCVQDLRATPLPSCSPGSVDSSHARKASYTSTFEWYPQNIKW